MKRGKYSDWREEIKGEVLFVWRSKPHSRLLKKGEALEEFGERVRCIAVRAFSSWGIAEVGLYAV